MVAPIIRVIDKEVMAIIAGSFRFMVDVES